MDLAQRVSIILASRRCISSRASSPPRDTDEFTSRKPETAEVDFTPPQRQLHDDLLAAQRTLLQQVHGDANLKFMMTTIRRQSASSPIRKTPLAKRKCIAIFCPFICVTRRLTNLCQNQAITNAVPALDYPRIITTEIYATIDRANERPASLLRLRFDAKGKM